MNSSKVSFQDYYLEYHGHRIRDLTKVVDGVRGGRSVLWLLGDSTLDNKHWFNSTEAATNGYERVLHPSKSRPDVAHAINKECVSRGLGGSVVAINCAVEEATLGGRSSSLMEQDEFARDNLSENDVLVVSCGGNDIALRPSALTIVSIAALLAMPKWLISLGGSSPFLYHLVPGLGHFVRLFGSTTADFISRVCEKHKPKAVLVCMLYYLDEMAGGSWADFTLRSLGYDKDPTKLQLIMSIIYERATSQMSIPGVRCIVPIPLFKVLDGKTTEDYVQRVEPSEQGGRKLATMLVDSLLEANIPGLAYTVPAAKKDDAPPM